MTNYQFIQGVIGFKPIVSSDPRELLLFTFLCVRISRSVTGCCIVCVNKLSFKSIKY